MALWLFCITHSYALYGVEQIAAFEQQSFIYGVYIKGSEK
jgi:hypothetical protein